VLNRLQIQGEGFSRRLPQLNANEKISFIVSTEEEERLKLEFLANEATKSSDEDVYFEGAGGHCVTIVIYGDSKVSSILVTGPVFRGDARFSQLSQLIKTRKVLVL